MNEGQASLEAAMGRAMHANRARVILGSCMAIGACAAWGLLSSRSSGISDLRLAVYAVVAILLCLLNLWILRAPHPLTYKVMGASCAATCIALLICLWDSLFGEARSATHAGFIPLESTAVPLTVLFCFAYLRQASAIRLTALFIASALLLGLFYALSNWNRPAGEFAHGLWTINSFTFVAALTMVLALLHIRHATQTSVTLAARRDQLEQQTTELRQQLFWDEAVGCLNPEGLLDSLTDLLQRESEDITIAMLRPRHHPNPGDQGEIPENWVNDLEQAIRLLRTFELTDAILAYADPSTVVLWCPGNNPDALAARLERVQHPAARQPVFYAVARLVSSDAGSILLNADDVLEDLRSDLFLRVHCQPQQDQAPLPQPN